MKFGMQGSPWQTTISVRSWSSRTGSSRSTRAKRSSCGVLLSSSGKKSGLTALRDTTSQAHALAAELLVAYPTPLAPIRTPDLPRGAALYAQNCAACHGATGGGDGPLAADLDPPAIAFADVDRARQRSAFGLYQVINQGLDGTAMASFAHLSTDEQWDLAFYVGRFAFTEEQAAAGEKLWNEDAAVRARFPDRGRLRERAKSYAKALANDILR